MNPIHPNPRYGPEPLEEDFRRQAPPEISAEYMRASQILDARMNHLKNPAWPNPSNNDYARACYQWAKHGVEYPSLWQEQAMANKSYKRYFDSWPLQFKGTLDYVVDTSLGNENLTPEERSGAKALSNKLARIQSELVMPKQEAVAPVAEVARTVVAPPPVIQSAIQAPEAPEKTEPTAKIGGDKLGIVPLAKGFLAKIRTKITGPETSLP